MEKYAFVGFGDLGIQIFNLLVLTKGVVREIIVFDDSCVGENSEMYDKAYPFGDYKSDKFKDYKFIIGLGYKHLKLKNKIGSELLGLKRELPNIIHPSCFIHPNLKIGVGNIFYPLCNIDLNVSINNFNLFNNSVVVSHDTRIGSSNFLAPSVTLCGKVVVGNNNFIGAASCISNAIVLEDDVIVGIASSVTKNLKSNTFAIGNPLKIKESKFNLD